VTKHLHVLESAGLSLSVRQGREQVWKLRSDPLVGAREYLDAVAERWDNVLSRLKAYVEAACFSCSQTTRVQIGEVYVAITRRAAILSR
jgi:hypothetical protein